MAEGNSACRFCQNSASDSISTPWWRITLPLRTNFTVPVDHRQRTDGHHGPGAGRHDPGHLGPGQQADDFVRPGHLFPLIAKEGGVLRRAGHTEAAVDLARMAGLQPAGVLCEVLADDGHRATRDQLYDLSEKHHLEIITIEQLIQYRRKSEKLVYRLAEADLPTRYGPGRIIAYGVRYEDQEPIAIVLGNPQDPRPGTERPWCDCIPPVSPAICWPPCAAIAATSCNWPWR